MNPFKIVLQEYPKEKKINPKASHNKDSPLYISLFQQMPKLINKWIKQSNFSDSSFKLVSSIGRGSLADIPWIACFNTRVTNQASTGYYIVFLFSADHGFFYLNLAQAVTKNIDGTPMTASDINQMKLYARIAKDFISKSNTINEHFGPIDLQVQNPNSVGSKYGKGTIKGYKYTLSDVNLPNFIQHLKEQFLILLSDYNKLIEECGNDIRKLRPISDTLYQSIIQQPIPTSSKISLAGTKHKVESQQYLRNQSISKQALFNSGYLCEFNKDHTTFINKYDVKYVEGHHLIPLSNQEDFKNSLDIEENIVALCPNCHRQIHHAQDAIKNQMLNFFYYKRINILKNKGIKITLPQLKKYYINSELEE